MAEKLYPSFDIPIQDSIAVDDESTREFKPAPYFDFDKGDFVTDGMNRVVYADGKEAFKQWIQKMLYTPYLSCLAYMGCGIELDEAMHCTTRAETESTLSTSITETLMKHPCTERVYDFQFGWRGDQLFMRFTVQPKAWPAFDVSRTIVA